MSASHPLRAYLPSPRHGAFDAEAATPPTRLARARRDSLENDGGGGDAGVAAHGGPHKRLRKPTYTMRREEAVRLAEELRLLEARAELLRRQIGIPSRDDFCTLEQAERENRVMEEARRAQVLSLCGVQSELSRHLRDQFSCPLKMRIRLGTDRAERRATLMAIRSEKLRIAARCLAERYRGVNERRLISDVQAWTTDAGDFDFHRADIIHFAGVRSVREVHEAMTFFFANLEMSVSEAVDQLTLREDIDDVGLYTSNHRLLSSTCHGLELETNVVSFSDFSDGSGPGDEFGLLVMDCVDEDALFPYCPSKRVRKDLICALSVSSFRRPIDPLVIRSAADGPSHETEFVVVLRRCVYLSIHRPQFAVSAAALEDLRAKVAVWGDVMATTMNERLYGASATSGAV